MMFFNCELVWVGEANKWEMVAISMAWAIMDDYGYPLFEVKGLDSFDLNTLNFVVVSHRREQEYGEFTQRIEF